MTWPANGMLPVCLTHLETVKVDGGSTLSTLYKAQKVHGNTCDIFLELNSSPDIDTTSIRDVILQDKVENIDK